MINYLKLLILALIASSNLAVAAIYRIPSHGNDIIGHSFKIHIRKRDNINKLCVKYGISYHEMLEANPKVKPRRLRIGQTLIVPSQYILPKYKDGIVINTVELRLYYFTPDGKYVFTTPVGLGRSGWRTPTKKTKVIKKEEDPIWHVPESIAEWAWETKGKLLPDKIMPGPKNPLGKYAIYLQHRGYLIHGTNSPRSVGKYYSSGCIRLYAHAIKLLYEIVPVGTPVYLIHHSNKAGWLNGELYLEAHQSVTHDEMPTALNSRDAEQAIHEATLNRPATINWQHVGQIEHQRLGIPEVIGQGLNYAGYSISLG